MSAQNIRFKNEIVKVFNILNSAFLEFNDSEDELQKKVCNAYREVYGDVVWMPDDATNEQREGIRLEARESFIAIIDAVKHYGLKAIYEAGDDCAETV